MSRRRSLLVCRGCCCGTDHKHPGIDHEGQIVGWRAAAVVGTSVRVVGCLDACSRSNVVVLRDEACRRRVWLANVNTPMLTDAVARWLAEDLGLDQLPPELLANVFDG